MENSYFEKYDEKCKEKYSKDNNFRNLVSLLTCMLKNEYFTESDIQDALHMTRIMVLFPKLRRYVFRDFCDKYFGEEVEKSH